MIERKNHPERPYVVASWVLIWFGTILVVNPRVSVSSMGAGLWATGFLIQMVIVTRWLTARPGPGAVLTRTGSTARRARLSTRHDRHQASAAG